MFCFFGFVLTTNAFVFLPSLCSLFMGMSVWTVYHPQNKTLFFGIYTLLEVLYYIVCCCEWRVISTQYSHSSWWFREVEGIIWGIFSQQTLQNASCFSPKKKFPTFIQCEETMCKEKVVIGIQIKAAALFLSNGKYFWGKTVEELKKLRDNKQDILKVWFLKQ